MGCLPGGLDEDLKKEEWGRRMGLKEEEEEEQEEEEEWSLYFWGI